MRLSAAIREGSAMTHKIRGQMVDNDGGACALGAARLAGWLQYPGVAHAVFEMTTVPEALRPLGDGYVGPYNVVSLVAWFNDHTEMSREAIADWVELVEKEMLVISL